MGIGHCGDVKMITAWMLLVFSIVYNGPAVFSTCPETTVLEGSECYKIHNTPLPARLAEDQCQSEKGFLPAMNFYDHLTSANLQNLSLSNGNCYWVGPLLNVVYLRENMQVPSSFWGALKLLKFLFDLRDVEGKCPALCERGTKFKIDMLLCTHQLPHICGHSKTVVVQKKTQKRKPFVKKSYTAVVIRTLENTLIIGGPVFTLTVPVPTMCARICLKSEMCKLFNFNELSKECRGHSASVTYKEGRFWQVWAIKKR